MASGTRLMPRTGVHQQRTRPLRYRGLNSLTHLHAGDKTPLTVRHAQPYRHAEFIKGVTTPKEEDRVVDFEVDVRYRRVDMSEAHAFEARLEFARNVQQGEGGIQLAEAALQIAAEDDAIASHSTVKLPVASYLGRVQRMSEEIANGRIPERLLGGGEEVAEEVLQVVERYLFEEQRFQPLASGRSNLPDWTVLDNPGVWEDARGAYLNEVLVRRVGHPAALAVLMADVMRRLLAVGAVDFAVKMDCRGYEGLPKAVLLPGLSRQLLQGPHGLVNTCTTEALVELLTLLKRAYWPFAWDTTLDRPQDGGRGSHGGFRGAAKSAFGQEVSAELMAVVRVAQHRLQRGIWTSPGGGDLRRAVAAAERLVMVLDDPLERRDLAVLLLHAGQLGRARAELAAYLASPAGQDGDAFDLSFGERLMDLLDSMPGIEEEEQMLTSVEWVLSMAPPSLDEAPKVPLTW